MILKLFPESSLKSTPLTHTRFPQYNLRLTYLSQIRTMTFKSMHVAAFYLLDGDAFASFGQVVLN